MSTRAQSRFPLTGYVLQDIALDREVLDFTGFRPPQDYHSSNLPMVTPTTHFLQSYVNEHSTLSIPERAPLPRNVNQVYTPLSTSTHVNQQIQHNLPWTHMQMVPEPLPTTSSPIVVRETHDDDLTSASHSAYDPGPHGIHWNTHAASGHSWALWPGPNSSDSSLLPHHVGQDICDPRDHPLAEPSAERSFSHATRSHYPCASNNQNVADPFIPPHLTHHQSSSASLPHLRSLSRPTPPGYLEPNPGFHVVPPQESTASSRRRRDARAIEYGGLWVDEEELLEALKVPDIKFIVHQCHWEEDRSPCHLWVKSDKSYISAHIQKWHGGRPGGDKLEANCRWSGCGKSMLKESIARHILSVHLGEMWECQGCEKRMTRKDAYRRHAVRSDTEGCRTAGALITYSVDAQVIDARAALNGGGRLRYVDA